MYIPAVTLMRNKSQNTLTRFRDRLLAGGRSRMCVVGALMRKLFQIAYGVLKPPLQPLSQLTRPQRNSTTHLLLAHNTLSTIWRPLRDGGIELS